MIDNIDYYMIVMIMMVMMMMTMIINDVTMISDFVTNSYGESLDSSCQKL